jgi:hypothetical protein
MDKKQLVLVAAICGGVVALGSLLPWTTAKGLGFTGSSSGVDGFKGVLVLLAGLAAGGAALLVHLGKVGQVLKLDERQHLWIAIGAFGLALLLSLIQFFDGHYRTETAHGVTMGWSRGFGLWLDLLGSIAGGATAWLAMQKGSAPTGGAPPPAAS